MSKISSWHIGISAEAFAAAQFARFGYDVSVQYGANQPEYDLMVHRKENNINRTLNVSVKGSQDGGWGLTQSYKKGRSYHQAIDMWLANHGDKTIFCLVQFEGVDDEQIPKMYLATPEEIAEKMKSSRNGNGDTILYVKHKWIRGEGAGSEQRIPDEWKFTAQRVEELFDKILG